MNAAVPEYRYYNVRNTIAVLNVAGLSLLLHSYSNFVTCQVKCLDKSFSVFYAPLKAGLQLAEHCCRVAKHSEQHGKI